MLPLTPLIMACIKGSSEFRSSKTSTMVAATRAKANPKNNQENSLANKPRTGILLNLSSMRFHRDLWM